MKFYNKAIELAPNIALARAENLHGQDKYEETIEWYDKFLHIKPNDVRALNNKGLALGNMQKFKEAIELYDKAIELDPSYLYAWYNKASTLSNLGKYEEAIGAYDKAIQIAPSYAEAWYYKGLTLDKLGGSKKLGKFFGKVRGKNEAKECFDKARHLGLNV